jgi:hypothetical protein
LSGDRNFSAQRRHETLTGFVWDSGRGFFSDMGRIVARTEKGASSAHAAQRSTVFTRLHFRTFDPEVPPHELQHVRRI